MVMKQLYFILAIGILLNIGACGGSGNENINVDNSNPVKPSSTFNWIVNTIDMAGAFSPFPLAVSPTLKKTNLATDMPDDYLVGLVSFEDGSVRAYPYLFLQFFESVNDYFDKYQYTITYCPLTDSGVIFDRELNGEILTTFSSGYLYKNNVITYDEKSDTYWSQLLMRCIRGKYENTQRKTINLVETNWGTVKKYFPNAFVFTENSIEGFDSSELGFSNGINGEKGIYGIIEDLKMDLSPEQLSVPNKVLAYKYEVFGDGFQLRNVQLNSKDILVIGSRQFHIITSYYINKGDDFSIIQNEFPIVMQDKLGNKWNIFGIAVDGPDKGKKLNSPNAYVAARFAWEDFYPNLELQN